VVFSGDEFIHAPFSSLHDVFFSLTFLFLSGHMRLFLRNSKYSLTDLSYLLLAVVRGLSRVHDLRVHFYRWSIGTLLFPSGAECFFPDNQPLSLALR